MLARLAALGLTASLLIYPISSAPRGGCAWEEFHCGAASSGQQVDVSARTDANGSQGASERSGPTEAELREARRERIRQERAAECAAGNPISCRPLPGYEIVIIGVPDVTAEDLSSFRPAPPTLVGEPAGFGLVGMPTNLVTSAATHELEGVLLDWPVRVRFEPAAFVFDYGDGTTRRTTTGGSSWEALGAPQFTPTDTTHVYRARGSFTVSVTVEYAAMVDFGRGWRPVTGFVTATTGGYAVQVVEARTALVDRDCLLAPASPGC